MKGATTGVLAAVLALPLAVGPAAATTHSGAQRLAVHRGPTICHGDATERVTSLDNNTGRTQTVRVQMVTRRAGAVADTQDFHVTVEPGTSAEVSVSTRTGEVSKLLITRRGVVLTYRAGLRAICW